MPEERRRRLRIAKRIVETARNEATRAYALALCVEKWSEPCTEPCDACWQEADDRVREAMLEVANKHFPH